MLGDITVADEIYVICDVAYPQSIFILIFSGYSDIYSLLRKKDEDNIFYVIMESH